MANKYSGVVDISNEEYHAHESVSRSGVLHFKRAPLFYWHHYLNPDKPVQATVDIIKSTNALGVGNATHTMILEPDTFDERYMVWDGPARTTKAGKQQFLELKECAGSREIIDVDVYLKIVAMRDAVYARDDARSLLEGAKVEQSFFWTDPETMLQCKARPDAWHDNFILDLKTDRDASLSSFQRDTYARGYHIQAAMQYLALKEIYGIEMTNFVYVVVEKEPPYAIALYKLDESALMQGVQEFMALADRMMRCFEKNQWPSYQTNVVTLPSWAIKNGDSYE